MAEIIKKRATLFFNEWFCSLSKEDQDEVIKPPPSSSFFDDFDVDESKEFKLKRD
jgi:hypothetical protein